jgi:hypothetical protein
LQQCPGSQPGPCYRCVDGKWVYMCGTSSCCEDLTCYDPSTMKCCGDGFGSRCYKNDTCCYGNCCDPCRCQDCVGGVCKYRCDSYNCYTCLNGHCVYQCDLATQCCCTSDPRSSFCVNKCNPNGGCFFQWPYLEVPSTGCASQDPTDLSCGGFLSGSICAWVAESYYTTSAECATCAPDCRNQVGYCVKLTPWKCNDDWIWTLGWVCVCNADDAGPPHDAGPHYVCSE